MKTPKPALGPEALQLLESLNNIADGIAAVASTLPPSEAEDHIESELAKTAILMRKYEAKAATPATSIGFAIDVCLREQIKARLAER